MFDFVSGTCPQDARLYDVNAGIIAGTMVATTVGWRPIESVAIGDQVLTFDGGMQTVRGLSRQIITVTLNDTHPEDWPLFVPAGALGNRNDMTVLPHQALLIESDTAEDLLGDPFAMVPALSLEGFRGITKITPPFRFEVVSLTFDQDEVVYGNSGALFYCPFHADLTQSHAPTYNVLPVDLADMLVTALEGETSETANRRAA